MFICYKIKGYKYAHLHCHPIIYLCYLEISRAYKQDTAIFSSGTVNGVKSSGLSLLNPHMGINGHLCKPVGWNKPLHYRYLGCNIYGLKCIAFFVSTFTLLVNKCVLLCLCPYITRVCLCMYGHVFLGRWWVSDRLALWEWPGFVFFNRVSPSGGYGSLRDPDTQSRFFCFCVPLCLSEHLLKYSKWRL